MVLHRLTGALTAACMLHLSVVASDAVCATHMERGHEVPDGMQMASDAADTGATMDGRAIPVENRPSRPCDTPAQRDCCQALTSCALTFAASGSAPVIPVIERVAISQRVLDFSPTEPVAPDTPPPKP